jgi:hypothetical protein
MVVLGGGAMTWRSRSRNSTGSTWLGFGVRCLEFEAWSLGSGVLVTRLWGAGFEVPDSGFQVPGAGCRGSGLGFGVLGFGFREGHIVDERASNHRALRKSCDSRDWRLGVGD